MIGGQEMLAAAYSLGEIVLWALASLAVGLALLAAFLGWLLRCRKALALELSILVQEALAPLHARLEELGDSVRATRLEEQPSGRETLLGSAEEVAAWTLEEARARVDADGAALLVEGLRPEPLFASAGVPPQDRLPLPAPPVRAVTAVYRYPEGDRSGEEEPFRSALFVALRSNAATVGTLSAYWRRRDWQPGREEIAALEEVAARSAAAFGRFAPRR